MPFFSSRGLLNMNTNRCTLIAAAFGVVASLGCSDDTNSPNNTNANRSNVMTTMTNGMMTGNTNMTMTVMTGMTSMCTDTASCGANECGMIDRGVCGVLDCGACECQGGQLQGSGGCGPCGLAQPTCEEGATGPARCDTMNLEDLGLEGEKDVVACQEALIFVEAGSQSGRGTKAAPYGTYAEAVGVAKPGQILVLSNAAPFVETIVVRDGVHILGGAIREEAQWTLGGVATEIQVPFEAKPTRVGMWVDGVKTKTYIRHVSLSLDDGPGSTTAQTKPSDHIGLAVIDSENVVIEDSVIASGRPDAGAMGEAGIDGSAGLPGKAGLPGIPSAEFRNNMIITHAVQRDFNSNTPEVQALLLGPEGGKNPGCAAAGGVGGHGGHRELEIARRPSFSYTLGLVGPKFGGGGEGNPSFNGGIPSGRVEESPLAVSPGKRGEVGEAGRAGQVTDSSWSIRELSPRNVELVWTYEGADGAVGSNGKDGGGGGGGAGQHLFEYNVVTSPPLNDQLIAWSWGPSGGSGGAGGCGGTGGSGGQAGGSAFGVVVFSGTVQLTRTEIVASLGGSGGAGATGGTGGQGAQGGVGGNYTSYYAESNWPKGALRQTSVFQVSSAGFGSSGGTGGRGGHGGGGAGGASIGIWCTKEGSALMQQSQIRSEGQAFGGGFAENQGGLGLSEETMGCK